MCDWEVCDCSGDGERDDAADSAADGGGKLVMNREDRRRIDILPAKLFSPVWSSSSPVSPLMRASV